MVILAFLLMDLNAFFPTEESFPFMAMVLRLESPLNAFAPIFFTFFPMVILVIPLFPERAFFAMAVTLKVLLPTAMVAGMLTDAFVVSSDARVSAPWDVAV